MTAIARPAFLLVSGRAIGLAASFAIGIVLARTFDPGTFGVYKQFFLVYATIYGLAQLGMAESLYFFVPKRPGHVGRYVANAMASLAAAGLICTTLLYAARHGIAAWFNTPALAGFMLPLGLFLTCTLVSTVLEIVMISRKQHLKAAITYAVSDIVRTLMFVLPALAFLSLRAVFIGATVFAALRALATVAALWKEFGHELRVDLSIWRSQLAYALPFALAVGIEIVQINYHQYVVASRFDAATFAVYAIGVLQIPLVDLIVTSTVNVLMVKMAEDASDGPAALALWHDTIARLAFLLIPLTVFLLLGARDLIVGLFTATYADSVPIFRVWALAVLPNIFAVDAVLRVYAQTRFLLLMNAIRLALVAVCIGWCLSTFGLAGAVLVTLLATSFVKLLGVARIVQVMQVPVFRALPWTRLAATALMACLAAVPVLWLRRLIVMPELVALFVQAAIYGGTYFAIAYAATLSSRFTAATQPKALSVQE